MRITIAILLVFVMFVSCGVQLPRWPAEDSIACVSIWPVSCAAPFGPPDEELAPDSASTLLSFWWHDYTATCTDGESCLSGNCYLSVDESPQSPDGILAASTRSPEIEHFGFPVPAASPSLATNAQVFEVVMTRCDVDCLEAAGGTDPTYDIRFSCLGVLKETIATGIPITSLGQVDRHAFTFVSDVNCAADGGTVELGIVVHNAGAGGDLRRPCVDVVEFEVTY